VGTLTYANEWEYVGEWKDGRYHGQGAITVGPKNEFAGDTYVGEFKGGKYHRQGTYTWADGTKYVGEYKNGKRHGQGTKTFPDGSKYVGEFKDEKFHGQGTYNHADGRVWIGLFSDDNWVSGRKYAAGEAPSSEGPYSGAVPSMGIDAAKAQCEDLGFNKGTEAFGECVLKLIR
jgi:hypothetical protein